MRRTRLPRSFAGHPARPFLSSPAGTVQANSWLVSCPDAHARPLGLGPSWAWTAVLQQLPGFVALVRCGRCACVARLGVGPTAFLPRGGASHGGLRSQLCKHGGNGWPDSAPPRYHCSSLLFRLWAICLPGLCGVMPHSVGSWPHMAHARCCLHQGIGTTGNRLRGRFSDWGWGGPAVEAGNACELFFFNLLG